MMKSHWMIYGAYGYSGRLLAEEAVRRGLQPVLAGRDESKLIPVAEALNLPYRVFGLDDPKAVEDNLLDMHLVVHCAGPFSQTSAPMIEACLAAQCHYFDITGEIEVFEHAHSLSMDARAKEAGIIVCPGVGFDVIPTDCVAAKLAAEMPDATHLTLGFSGGSALSPGTAKTSIEGLAGGNKVRCHGQIVTTGVKTRTIDFGKGPRQAMNIAWGDVSTAYHSTGIGNIEVYIPASDKTLRVVKLTQLLKPALRVSLIQDFIKKQLGKRVTGPDQRTRQRIRSLVWGEVANAKGQKIEAFLETPNGYDVTIYGPLAIVAHMLNNSEAESGLPSGSLTPSKLMGADFVSTLPDTGAIKLVRHSV